MSEPERAGRGPASRRLPRLRGPGWLALPSVVFLLLLFVWPLTVMVVASFTDPQPGLANYQRVFATSSIVRSMWFTAALSALVTVICAVVGYGYTYTLVKTRDTLRTVLLMVILVPALVSLLVRVFALQVLLQDQGLVNKALIAIGLVDAPISLIRTPFAIGVGMVTTLLPFMVFPLYATMSRIDPDLMTAAGSLGARPLVAFRRVFLPLSVPGLVAGSLLVFISSLGYFVVPQLLGDNARSRFLSQYVSMYVAQGQWGYGAAIGAVLLVMTLVTLLLVGRLINVGDILRASVGGR